MEEQKKEQDKKNVKKKCNQIYCNIKGNKIKQLKN